MWPFQIIFHSYITASHEDEPASIHTHIEPRNVSLNTGEGGKKEDNNNNDRLVFQRRGSGALQLAGNDKYLHAAPAEGQQTAAPLSRRGILTWRRGAARSHLRKPQQRRKLLRERWDCFVCRTRVGSLLISVFDMNMYYEEKRGLTEPE